jgi:hypothetical protein
MSIILFVTLLLTILAFVGYYLFWPEPESSVFKDFSLKDTIQKIAHTGIDCSSSPFEAEGFGVSKGGTRFKTIPIWCEVKEASGKNFDEHGFLEALQSCNYD